MMDIEKRLKPGTVSNKKFLIDQKIATIQEAQLLIDDFIDFYNRERNQIKTGQAQR